MEEGDPEEGKDCEQEYRRGRCAEPLWSAGGTVVKNERTWAWLDAGGDEKRLQGLRQAFGAAVIIVGAGGNRSKLYLVGRPATAWRGQSGSIKSSFGVAFRACKHADRTRVAVLASCCHGSSRGRVSRAEGLACWQSDKAAEHADRRGDRGPLNGPVPS